MRPSLWTSARCCIERFRAACEQIDFGRTELIPQNMAPFPWHFGGQRHQNIFMMPDELAAKARELDLRLCLDLSHLQMTCNHFAPGFSGRPGAAAAVVRRTCMLPMPRARTAREW